MTHLDALLSYVFYFYLFIFVKIHYFKNFKTSFGLPADLGVVGAEGVLGEQTASARALERGYLSAPQRF